MRGLTESLYAFFEKHRLLFWLVLSSCFLLFTALALRVSFDENTGKMLQSVAKTPDYPELIVNAHQIRHDAALALAVMCVWLLILILLVFRKKRAPLLIFLPVLFGMVFALACISFIKPVISLISIGAALVLLGIAVNYPLHILIHGLRENNLRKVIGNTAGPLTITSVTTIGGFLSLLFVKTDILRDFGLLAAFGLPGTVLFSLIFLPHLIGNPANVGKPVAKWLEKAGRLQPDKSLALRWAVICITPVFLYFSQFIEFDSDLMHLSDTPPGLFIAIITAFLVFGALLLSYGRIELAITGFLPMAVSWIWILGAMGLFHLKFNLVNIIPAAFIFGLGNDYYIFMLDGLVQGYARKTKPLPAIRMSILVSGLTMLIGFSLLLLAKHPALQSIALVAVFGIVSLLLTSQVLEPYLFRIFATGPVARGFAPVSFTTLIKSVFAYSYFITGCILLSIAGFLLLGINPFFRKNSQRLFNYLISMFALSQIYIMVNVTKIVVRDEIPDFSKPCVFVANHQSVLDILCLIMMSPKIILLTNKWVWNSPLFGYVVRFAGYYPIFEGAEPGIDILKTKIAEGYSIAIFPEGTRSKDGKIGRFHKGAFYLAHKLELDLIPVLFHRTCHCIAKGSFIVRDANFTVKILTRIKFSDPEYGTSYQQLTKSARNLFIKQYAAMEEEARTPERCRKRLIENFMFKGFLPEWTLRVRLQQEENYRFMNDLVPKEGTILEAGCGYGFLAYMLAYLSPQRKIIGYDGNEKKIGIAENGFDLPSNLRFVTGATEEVWPGDVDCIIFSDVFRSTSKLDRNHIFTNFAANLLPGGIIIVGQGYKHAGKRFSSKKRMEKLAIPVLNSEITDQIPTHLPPLDLIKHGESIGFESSLIEQPNRNSNPVLVFKKKNNG